MWSHAGLVCQQSGVECGSQGEGRPCRVALCIPRLCWFRWAIVFVGSLVSGGEPTALSESFSQQVHDSAVCFVREVSEEEAVPGEGCGESGDVCVA